MKTMKSLLVCVALSLLPGLAFATSPVSEVEELGRALYFDKTLSTPVGVSCATCHAPGSGWTGSLSDINLHGAVYPGAVPHRFGNRKPPSAAYASTSPLFDLVGDTFTGGNFWDGRATGWVRGNPAADQAGGPFLNPVEQNSPDMGTVVYKVCSSDRYENFAPVAKIFYPDIDGICDGTHEVEAYNVIAMSIAVFEDSGAVNRFTSKFDEYLEKCEAMDLGASCFEPWNFPCDPTGTLGRKVWEGFQLFVGPNDNDGVLEDGEGAACDRCHVATAHATVETAYSQALNVTRDGGWDIATRTVPPLFTDYTYDNLGTPKNPENPFYGMDLVTVNGAPINPAGADWIDPGLGGFLATVAEWAGLADENYGKHKVPTLRNVDKRPDDCFVKAYMHNGAFKSLKDVVHFYNARDAMMAEGTVAPEVLDTMNTDELGNLGLSPAQEDALVAFMEALSDRSPWK